MTRTDNSISLVASGDLRRSANQMCWPAQQEMEQKLAAAIAAAGRNVVRAHPYKEELGHGFIASQREGIEVFKRIDPQSPLIVAEAVWQYSHHVLPGLTTHRGPILTVANWSGTWPGLVGMLNLNGSLTKAGVRYSTLWSEDFTDDYFTSRLRDWLATGTCGHDLSHVSPFDSAAADARARELGTRLAEELVRDKAIMGVFDEGCMGMYNAIIPDQLLHATGVFKERLSQSALYYETMQVSDDEASAVRHWLEERGMRFHTGPTHESDLTDAQIHLQCKMYLAAMRMADDFGCDLIGIQYQQGLKDLLPASDLVEGILNNADRPPVRSRDGRRVLREGEPLVHFNEVDECAGLDAADVSCAEGDGSAGGDHAARRPLGRRGPHGHGGRLRVGISHQRRRSPSALYRRLGRRRGLPSTRDVLPQRRQHPARNLQAGRNRLVAHLRGT